MIQKLRWVWRVHWNRQLVEHEDQVEIRSNDNLSCERWSRKRRRSSEHNRGVPPGNASEEWLFAPKALILFCDLIRHFSVPVNPRDSLIETLEWRLSNGEQTELLTVRKQINYRAIQTIISNVETRRMARIWRSLIGLQSLPFELEDGSECSKFEQGKMRITIGSFHLWEPIEVRIKLEALS